MCWARFPGLDPKTILPRSSWTSIAQGRRSSGRRWESGYRAVSRKPASMPSGWWSTRWRPRCRETCRSRPRLLFSVWDWQPLGSGGASAQPDWFSDYDRPAQAGLFIWAAISASSARGSLPLAANRYREPVRRRPGILKSNRGWLRREYCRAASSGAEQRVHGPAFPLAPVGAVIGACPYRFGANLSAPDVTQVAEIRSAQGNGLARRLYYPVDAEMTAAGLRAAVPELILCDGVAVSIADAEQRRRSNRLVALHRGAQHAGTDYGSSIRSAHQPAGPRAEAPAVVGTHPQLLGPRGA